MWIIRALLTTAHVLVGLFCVFVVLRFLNHRQKNQIQRWYARQILRLFNIKPLLMGHWPKTPGLVVLNHISWIDIFVVQAHSPCVFIAKSEIAKWPLVGALVAQSGTIFIERKRRHAVVQAIRETTQKILSGGQVAIFPEGTTTNGCEVKPFHANLFQAAIDANCPVFSIALRYTDKNGAINTTPAFINDQTLWQNAMVLWKSSKPVFATLIVCNNRYQPSTTRQQLADAAHLTIANTLSLSTSINQKQLP
jgi:1-acyl-sn-glycerol-3-phosphate acyltransferase